MMKLGLMKQFFDTVDKDWQSPIADEIASKWFSEAPQVRCIRASANFAFHVLAGERQYLLRFNHAGERSSEFIAGEMATIEHLAERGIRVARPQLSLAGHLVESIITPMGLFHGVLFEFLTGKHLDAEEMDAAAIERWGRALGEMHKASEGFKIPGRPDWSAQIDMIRQIIPRSEALVWNELDVTEELFHALPISAANFGLIHYDFEPDNLVWSGDAIGIFDLDDCAYEWFAMDVSNALMSEFFDDRVERVDLADPRVGLFLKGYRSARAMDEMEVIRMPLFLRLDNLVAFGRVYRSISDGPMKDEPEWTTNLRQKLSRELDKHRESFQNHPIRTYLREIL